MKNKLAIGFSLGIGTMLLIAATEYDLNKGVDLTGASSVTATKLNQLVDNGTVATNKGMIIYSSTTPDTTNNARYTRFIWLNSSYTPPVPYVWNSSLSLWTNITAISSIADGSVTAGKLGANAVYATNIANAQIDNTKMVAGTVNSNILGANSVYNFHLTGSSIYSTNIANGQLLTANYGTASITGDKISPGSIGTSLLTNGFALQGTNIAAGTITSSNIAGNTIVATNLATNSITATYIATGTLPVKYVSGNLSVPAVGATITNSHGLAGTPTSLRVVLYCDADDAATGWKAGDEINIESALTWDGVTTVFALFAVYSDSSSVKILRNSLSPFYLLNKTTGATTQVTSTSNFRLKIYAVYVP